MHTFAQKPKATQKTTSAKTTLPPRAHFGQRREVNSILHLQRTIGNQDVQRILEANRGDAREDSATTEIARFGHDFSRIPVRASARAVIQPKLTVNTSGDRYEREADRVADQVMRMPEPSLQRTCACGGGFPKCANEGEGNKELQVQRLEASGRGEVEVPPGVHDVLRSPGQPLEAGARKFMESRFGHDFSQVRVHTDANAVESTRAVNALAYTVGHNMVFGAGAYAPTTPGGRKLVAHELTHVVQQSSGAPGLQRLAKPACAPPAGNKVSNDTKKNNMGEFGWCIFENAGSNGVSAHIEYDADAKKTDCGSLNWIQTLHNYKGAKKDTFYLNNDVAYYSSFDIGTGTYLDHSKSVGETNPLYNTSPGALTDLPALRTIAGERGQTFETSPFCAKGKEEGSFYGGISWGWDLGASGTFSLQTPTVRSDLKTPATGAPEMFQTLDKFLGQKAQAGFNRSTVEFDTGSSVLSAAAKTTLDGVATRLTSNADEQAWVIGHTDLSGSAKGNLATSHQRAKVVEDYLKTKGIGIDRVFRTGFGETMPKVVTQNSKKENRRAEIFVIDPARTFSL